jgi:hypothetical protein
VRVGQAYAVAGGRPEHVGVVTAGDPMRHVRRFS